MRDQWIEHLVDRHGEGAEGAPDERRGTERVGVERHRWIGEGAARGEAPDSRQLRQAVPWPRAPLRRSQHFVDDREYMKGMIPHHSIAILTSERSDIDEFRVCELANQIIRAQREEIAEMDWLIDDIADNGEATTPEDADARTPPELTAEDVRDDCPTR